MNKSLLTLLFITLLILLFLSWQYIFNIYEVEIKLETEELQVFNKAGVEIIPVNSFGFKVPFRSVDYSISFIEGEDLVNLIRDKEQTNFELVAQDKTGKVKFSVATNKSQNPTIIEIQIIKPGEL